MLRAPRARTKVRADNCRLGARGVAVLSRRSKTVLGGWGAGVVVAASVVISGGVASAAPSCGTTPSDRVPGIEIEDPACDFTALPGATAYTGILRGSAYRIEVPDDWNGDL